MLDRLNRAATPREARDQDAPAESALPPSFPERLVALRSSGGAPLPDATRSFMETRFGRDFGHVRIHTDDPSATLAREAHARAFTVGHDIVFGHGHYQPAIDAGRHLIAHELAHVVQQGEASDAGIQRKVEVGAGLSLNTRGYTVTKAGNVYTCPRVVKHSLWNEIFTALFASPRVFKLEGTSNAEIDASLTKHMAARWGIVDFASKKRYSFGAGADFRMNPDYWVVTASGFELKSGVDRTEAINDLNVHPEKYSIACSAATVLTLLGGGGPYYNGTSPANDDWVPGDAGYITNTSFPAGGTPGLEGENIIYTGNDKFWGHFGPGNQYKTLMQWFDQVQGWHGSANIEDLRRYPRAGLGV